MLPGVMRLCWTVLWILYCRQCYARDRWWHGVVDDTGFPKKGKESVGVARQYCGQVGKQDNCRVAVSLSVTTDSASMPVAYRLYLPEVWIKDSERRKKTGVPEGVQFQTKPE